MHSASVSWFDTSAFMPHGHCFLWTPSLLVMHVGADVLIGAAYLVIPFGLFALLRQRPDLPFRSLFLWFSVFISCCGLTHWVAAWNVWHAEYWIEGLVKAATALASVPAAIALWRAMPAIRALPSHQQLEVAVDELRASNAELEAFVSTAAHDLRSPLEGVRLLLDTMVRDRRRTLAEPDRTALASATGELRRMSAAVDARLKLARLAREPLNVARLDLTAMATRIASRLQGAHPETRVQLTIAPNMFLVGDPAMVETLLDNLLGNAWKFSARVAVPRVEVELRSFDRWDELHVRDNGIGFDGADVGRLFKPLVRLPSARDFPGQGIGLATVARIAERHGGTVRAEPAAGSGAEFVVTWPGKMPRNARSSSATGQVALA